MKTMSVSALSFGQVYVQEPMNRFQRRKANKLANDIKQLRDYYCLEDAGIDVNIKLSQDRGKVFNRNLMSIYYTQGKVNEYSNFWFKKENEKEILEKSGNKNDLYISVKDFAEKVWRSNSIVREKIVDREARAILENLDMEKAALWPKSKIYPETGDFLRYYDKEKKCVFDIKKYNAGDSEKERYSYSVSHEGYEYNEEKNAIYLEGFTKDGYKFHKEYLLDSPKNYRNIEYHPNGIVAYDYYLNGENEYENRYDSQGRVVRKYSCEYGRYLSDAWFDPETGEVTSAKSDIL